LMNVSLERTCFCGFDAGWTAGFAGAEGAIAWAGLFAAAGA